MKAEGTRDSPDGAHAGWTGVGQKQLGGTVKRLTLILSICIVAFFATAATAFAASTTATTSRDAVSHDYIVLKSILKWKHLGGDPLVNGGFPTKAGRPPCSVQADHAAGDAQAQDLRPEGQLRYQRRDPGLEHHGSA